MSTKNDYDRDLEILERKIEALLFASDIPLSVTRLMAFTGVQSAKEVKNAIESIDRFYREHRRSFEIVEVAGGYQIITLTDYADTVSQLFRNRRKSRLSQPALETLAIVAYRQPISRMEIEAIRGVNSEGVLATLTERELITISGRGEGVGRPYLYSTTRKFLEYLGLKDYKDLPSIQDFEKSFAIESRFIERPESDSAPRGETENRQAPGGE
jgi:segregation and condensation protein B